jgi:hypothetical protein
MVDEHRCTYFCNKLRTLSLTSGKLPSNDELISHLGFTDDEKGHGQRLGTLDELLQRTNCPFCQLVVNAVLDGESHDSHDGKKDIDIHHPIDVLLFPEEQSFRLSYPSRLSTRLAFLAGDDHQCSGPDTARLVVGPEVQPSKILGWLRQCEDHHSDTCHSSNVVRTICPNLPAKLTNDGQSQQTGYDFKEQATSNFRVIDLELGCVRRAHLDDKYIALSYVWGQLPMFKLLKSNHDLLASEGSLNVVRQNLPKTVNDAIDLVRNINERYLWIDA